MPSDPSDRREPAEQASRTNGESGSLIARWWAGFEPWRKLMLAGAVILLTGAIARAILKEDFPSAAVLIVNVAGYVLLAIGFAEAMRKRGIWRRKNK
jgi:hypothetical protein